MMKKIRLAVPYDDRMYDDPCIGFSSLAESFWETTQGPCDVVRMHESEITERHDYDVVLCIRRVGTGDGHFQHYQRNGIRIAVWLDDIHQWKWRTAWPSRKLINRFEGADIIFVTYIHQFLRWKPYKKFRDKVVWTPWSVPDWIFQLDQSWEDRKQKILLSGFNSFQYPFRKHLYARAAKGSLPRVDTLNHPGYRYPASNHRGIIGKDYYQLLTTYRGAIATTAPGTTFGFHVNVKTDYLVLKYFEIPACGCVPFMEHAPGLKDIGFVDKKNCILINPHNYARCFKFIDSAEAETVAAAAKRLIEDGHTHSHRVKMIMNHIVTMFDDQKR